MTRPLLPHGTPVTRRHQWPAATSSGPAPLIDKFLVLAALTFTLVVNQPRPNNHPLIFSSHLFFSSHCTPPVWRLCFGIKKKKMENLHVTCACHMERGWARAIMHRIHVGPPRPRRSGRAAVTLKKESRFVQIYLSAGPVYKYVLQLRGDRVLVFIDRQISVRRLVRLRNEIDIVILGV